MKYLALLRGINVGKKRIAMKDLSELFGKLGFKNIKTVLATGNIVFESNSEDKGAIKVLIEKEIESKYKFSVNVHVRDFKDIKEIIENNPFAESNLSKDIYWYVTFLDSDSNNIPEVNRDEGYKFLEIKNGVLFSVLDETKVKTLDFMALLDKTYGKNVTTRNWNTINKIIAISS